MTCVHRYHVIYAKMAEEEMLELFSARDREGD